MRVVVTGASGNVGTSVLAALARDPEVSQIVGLARRVPSLDLPKTTWEHCDLVQSDMVRLFAGADAVIHLAWLIQPARDQATVRAANVEGSARVFHAVASAGVGTLVYASSVGAYSPGPKDRRVDESWPTEGVQSSYYSSQKAEVERLLDRFELERPECRVVRLRPGLIFKREAASEIRRYFAGPLLPPSLVRRSLIPAVPETDRLAFQAVHSDDVAEAYRLAAVNDGARGAYNVAADPVLDPARLAGLLGARRVRVPQRLLRAAANLPWRARLQPTSPGWVDMALGVPLMDTARAEAHLGWAPPAQLRAGAAGAAGRYPRRGRLRDPTAGPRRRWRPSGTGTPYRDRQAELLAAAPAARQVPRYFLAFLAPPPARPAADLPADFKAPPAVFAAVAAVPAADLALDLALVPCFFASFRLRVAAAFLAAADRSAFVRWATCCSSR